MESLFDSRLSFCDPGSKGFLNLAIAETPYGMAPSAQKLLVLSAARGSLPYPDSSGDELVKKISSHYRVDPDMIFIGNGIDEIILCCSLVFLSPTAECLMCQPTFPSYVAGVKVAHGVPLYSPLKEMQVDVDRISSLLQKEPRLWFLCNPHNPTGTVVGLSSQRDLFEIAHRCGVVAFVDEAYAEYADPSAFNSAIPLVSHYPNLIVARTFSKIYGLAGLRCGYAIGNSRLIDKLKTMRNAVPFNVNRLALEVSPAALEDQDFVQSCYRKTEQVKHFFYAWLKEKAIPYIPSFASFVLVYFGEKTEWICDILKERYRVLIRSGSSIGVPGWIRVTLGSLEQMQHVIRCLEEVVSVYTRSK